MLAALLFQANRPVSQGSLRNALWGEEQPTSATASLHNHARRLRLSLGTVGGERLRSVSNGFALRVDDGESDIQDFTVLLARARVAREEGDWRTVSRHTAAAGELWRGRPLSDLPAVFGLEPEVRHLLHARVQALEWWFEAELWQGRHSELVPELARRVTEYPLHESFHVQLITALYRSGRQADALSVFEQVRVRLADELGADPGPALRTVHHQVLVCDPALLWQPEPVAAGVAETVNSTVDDATQPPIPSTPPATTGSAPAQLPADTSDFTGRARELQDLIDRLAAATACGQPSIVAVSGMGGIGKTTLAVHAAHQVRHLFPDGQLYVDLRGFGTGESRDPHDILAAFLADLNQTGDSDAQHRPVPEHPDERAALLRTTLASRRVLLVLDNVRDTAQVLPLLPGSGQCAVVVTSRTTLTDLPGALQLRLDPLNVEEQRSLLSALCGSDRVQQDRDGALRLLAACAGLPLALRITGARLAARPTWSLTTLAQRLDSDGRRLQELSIGHLAVYATFASSYLAMRDSSRPSDREAARAFRLLGLWPAYPLSLQAAAVLLGKDVEDTADVLDILVDAHLLQNPSIGSYRFHALLGEFAAQQAVREVTEHERNRTLLRLLTWWHAAAHKTNVQMDHSQN
ncbi:BTAD domain-containing putative transcriptional regulator [Kitasatospora sp. NPDC001175]|uniref:AfsR/SARP family transcriptional regulator n=1 Tax=Kitasatospora sp. NPDC001175 TaxID=3157103 RepID=UPI003D031F8E